MVSELQNLFFASYTLKQQFTFKSAGRALKFMGTQENKGIDLRTLFFRDNCDAYMPKIHNKLFWDWKPFIMSSSVWFGFWRAANRMVSAQMAWTGNVFTAMLQCRPQHCHLDVYHNQQFKFFISSPINLFFVNIHLQIFHTQPVMG